VLFYFPDMTRLLTLLCALLTAGCTPQYFIGE